MSVVVRSRRQFLVGTGGATLALPLLTSLLPKAAQAQAARPKRFVSIASGHGAVRESNMYPAERFTDRRSMYPGHEVSSGRLALEDRDGMAALSSVLRAPSGTLTPSLVGKMNVLRGFDLAWNLGHHTGGHLGNFARNDANKIADKWQPTIDQIMAYSSSFYPDLTTIRNRSMHVGQGGNFAISWGYASPETKSGDIQAVSTSYSSKRLFDAIFVPKVTTEPVNPRKPVVDLVHDAYKALSSGASPMARRLSKVDRDRLNQHVEKISELQRRVNAVANCDNVSPPDREVNNDSGGLTNDVVYEGSTREYYQTFNDVIVAAFVCGTSRIATIYPHSFTQYAGDWHNDIVHVSHQDDHAQSLVVEETRRFFEYVFLDLVSKLEQEPEGEGRTFLDNTLVAWSQESGFSTHDPFSIPIVTAGSAGDWFKTGLYADFRRLGGPTWSEHAPGVLYNQWLANVLLSMGVPRSEFESPGEQGYGYHNEENVYGPAQELWPHRLRSIASDPLPLITG